MEPMNSGLKFGVIVFAAVLIVCCGGFMLLLSPVSATVGKKEKEAKSYGDNYTRQILRNYDASALVSLATPEYRATFSQSTFQESLDANKGALGKFVSGKGSATLTGAAKQGKERILRAKYQNRATFEKGKARVRINLMFAGGKWSIEQFAIEPD